ncbi:insulinase family protein [Leadbettera azotonutricia]|uniref:Peptidase, M16 family n=1 Tax=Leadbettera azotonutricia (strain ATCC BAA-888 / DSM 13862 / ZAS-9) TaxID=545695 RepID=F5YE06_LEAAZ|nr:insulinase family protein [Leadbettera azotonutricia]AEF82721.1 peptidase, M16 family [Leadbettera azotonutricia ZAS-9]
MIQALKKGQILDSGFEILEVKDLAELEAIGIWARHQKSGAEVFHVLNDDSENLFGFSFATAPDDSTGVAHIIEHSVLCGSKNYPLKDAFLVLAQGSLQTFLNAWTFPDKTVYPASSINERDYFNLMGVYGDAVFRPTLSEWTFMQEGHRFEYAEDKLSITGVVYNEMKGNYSSLDSYAGDWSIRAVLPNTAYDFDSGGDPDCIPGLSWEQFKEFHRSRYSPANCKVFLAGNIPTEKQLTFLNDKFFSSLPAGKAAAPVSKVEAWTEPRAFTVVCPAGAETKSTVLLSWLCGDSTDPMETLSLGALVETLLGHDGSPLTRALIDSGLGEDLSPATGLEGEIRESVFCAGLRGVDGKEKETETLILGELERLAKEGIPKEEIEAALLSMEFSHREIRRSGGPFSLVWMRRSLRGWLHGANPWSSLLFAPYFAELKQKLASDPHYFEKLIKKYFIDNPHRACVIIKPEKDFLEKKEAALSGMLAEKEASLSTAEKEAIQKKSAELLRIQEESDSPEALSTIPHLSRKDLSAEIEKVPRDLYTANGTPVLAHPLFTNGITYADLAFPVDVLEPEDYPWLPFFSRAVVSVGLPGLDYGEVSSLLAQTVGGFHATLQGGTSAPGAAKAAVFPSGIFDIGGRDWLVYHLKALDEKFGSSLDLALRLVSEADFTDLKRIRDLAVEMKNDADSSLAPAGHMFASLRSSRGCSRAKLIDEIWGGLDSILFAHRLVEMGSAEIRDRLVSIRDRLVGGGMLGNLCGSSSSIEKGLGELGQRFGRFGAPRPRKAANAEASAFAPHSSLPLGLSGRPEVFSSPSLQVGFASFTLPAAPFGSKGQAAELVLSHLLSTGALWETIRMKGGAYGAFAQSDNLEGVFAFSTYRDPDPQRSLEAFSSIIKELATPMGAWDENDELEKAIIGSYSKETRPRTSAEKSLSDFYRFLYGIEDRHRSKRLKSLVAVSGNDISAALERLAASIDSNTATGGKGPFPHPVIIAGRTEAEKAAAQLGTGVTELPV